MNPIIRDLPDSKKDIPSIFYHWSHIETKGTKIELSKMPIRNSKQHFKLRNIKEPKLNKN